MKVVKWMFAVLFAVLAVVMFVQAQSALAIHASSYYVPALMFAAASALIFVNIKKEGQK